MESTANLNHHQHQLQDHQLLLASSSSSSSSSSSLSIVPSYFGLGTAWSSNISLNNNNTCNVYDNPTIFNGEVTTTNSSHPIRSSDCSNNFFTQSLHHSQQQISSTPPTTPPPPPPHHQSFPKFTEILNNNNNITNLQDFININNNNDSDLNDLTHKLLIKTLISSGCQINGTDHPIISRSSNNNRPPHFPQIYPSINVSNWNLSSQPPPPPSFSNSLDLNLQTPADMLVGSFRQDNFGIFKETVSDFHDQIQESPPTGTLPCIIPSKMTTYSSAEECKPKRGCNSMESRLNQQSPPLKKSRLDSRASCPPFKVRKEKLGDRIAALQQLVAPFGKTDTASVLMEAIGYIKFLQNQVETLSVPYMKPAGGNKATQPTHRSSVEDGNEGGQNRDLRSRGLCLVPLGCLSYVTGDSGGGVGIWPPPGFNGGTS
ncbi:transcription factor bHLH110 isoform X3 [Cucumis sativus]|uniref:transcription factor bHLH110 isoform X3 n=1 Tax=Cucumis sativus TaxID=3659 RepID=UPI0005ED1518|nr:transcription factor bHLH110 isoform X3 [Cucumis sativus]KAE8651332.1 hypothetical protein Csa_001641 [Cucumis sativus]